VAAAQQVPAVANSPASASQVFAVAYPANVEVSQGLGFFDGPDLGLPMGTTFDTCAGATGFAACQGAVGGTTFAIACSADDIGTVTVLITVPAMGMDSIVVNVTCV
jgi:hypothetical protein